MQLRIGVVLAVLLCMAFPVQAQFNSAVQGIFQDPSRAVIPNAAVKLLNPGNAQTLETKTNESGYYRFSSLGPGSYDLTIEAAGFQTKVIKITITTGQIRDLNIDM